jgi:hypothetical protein
MRVTVITVTGVTVPVPREAGGGFSRPRSRPVGPGKPVQLDEAAAERLIRLGAARRPEEGEEGYVKPEPAARQKRSPAKRETT